MKRIELNGRQLPTVKRIEVRNEGHLLEVLRSLGIKLAAGESSEIVNWFVKAGPLDKIYLKNVSIKILYN